MIYAISLRRLRALSVVMAEYDPRTALRGVHFRMDKDGAQYAEATDGKIASCLFLGMAEGDDALEPESLIVPRAVVMGFLAAAEAMFRDGPSGECSECGEEFYSSDDLSKIPVATDTVYVNSEANSIITGDSHLEMRFRPISREYPDLDNIFEELEEIPVTGTRYFQAAFLQRITKSIFESELHGVSSFLQPNTTVLELRGKADGSTPIKLESRSGLDRPDRHIIMPVRWDEYEVDKESDDGN